MEVKKWLKKVFKVKIIEINFIIKCKIEIIKIKVKIKIVKINIKIKVIWIKVVIKIKV